MRRGSSARRVTAVRRREQRVPYALGAVEGGRPAAEEREEEGGLRLDARADGGFVGLIRQLRRRTGRGVMGGHAGTQRRGGCER
eukprot:7269158-Prymnesium_polylepis.1